MQTNQYVALACCEWAGETMLGVQSPRHRSNNAMDHTLVKHESCNLEHAIIAYPSHLTLVSKALNVQHLPMYAAIEAPVRGPINALLGILPAKRQGPAHAQQKHKWQPCKGPVVQKRSMHQATWHTCSSTPYPVLPTNQEHMEQHDTSSGPSINGNPARAQSSKSCSMYQDHVKHAVLPTTQFCPLIKSTWNYMILDQGPRMLPSFPSCAIMQCSESASLATHK